MSHDVNTFTNTEKQIDYSDNIDSVDNIDSEDSILIPTLEQKTKNYSRKILTIRMAFGM
jgi:protein associated with RNAse G/E